MTRRNGRTALRTGVAAGLWAMTLIGGVDASRAQEPDGRAVSITIPAKPLPQAIASLSAVTGLQVLYTGKTGRGLTSHPVSGVLTPEDALGTLLQGTGLTYVSRGPGAVTIEDTGSAGGGEASADGSIVLDTIVVQSPTFGTSGFVASRSTAGNKSNTPLIEVPSTVNVVTRDELDARDVQDVNQALAYTPGVRAIDYPGGQGAAQVYIRGFRTINSEGVYRDGLRAGFNAYDTNYEPYGLERLDVLKGPASSLYGQGQPGGIFNLVSKRPQFTPAREVAVQTGSHNRIQGTFDLTGPIQEGGVLAYRLTGLVRDSDTQTPYTPDDRIFLAPALTFEPSDQTSLTILGNYLQLRRGGSEQSLPISGALTSNPFGDYSRDLLLGEPDFNEEKVVNGSAGYIFDHAFNDTLRFQSVSRATRTDSHYQAVGALGTPLRNNRLYGRIPYDREQDSRSVQTDNRFEANFDVLGVEHTALVGLDVSRYKRDERRRIGSIGPIDIFDPVYGQPILLPRSPNISTLSELNQTGLYYQDQLKTNGFVVTLGGRNDWTESEMRNRIRNVGQTRRDDAFTYRAGLGYETDFGLVPFVNYATSFNPQVLSTFDGTAFEPAEGKQIEAGVKYQPADWNLFLQASVFEIRQTNVPTPDLAHPGYFVPTGEARSRGVELEAKASLAEGLDLTASYTYLDAQVTKDNANPLTGRSLEGKRLGAVPDHSASLWLDYTVQDDTFASLRLGGGLRYVGSTTNSTNVDHIPGYVLFDAALSYDAGRLDPRFEGLDVSLNVDNLFDKRYFTPGFYEGTVFQGFGRDIRGTLTYKW